MTQAEDPANTLHQLNEAIDAVSNIILSGKATEADLDLFDAASIRLYNIMANAGVEA